MKYLIFDSGPIISLSMNGLLPLLVKLKKDFDGEFVLTPAVKKELIDRPMKIMKFKLEAIKVSKLIEDGVFKMSSDFIDDEKLNRETNRIMKVFTGVVRSLETGGKINILHEGEASCLAFANMCNCNHLIVIDERTTRMVFEKIDSLKDMMEKKLHTPLRTHSELLKEVGEYRFVRSSEIVYLAYERDMIGYGKSPDILEALMFALKYSGTAISSREINEMKDLI